MNLDDILILDLETTGLNRDGDDEPIEIAVINGHGRVIINTLIKPTKKTEWPEAEKIHGITPNMVNDSNTTFDVIQSILRDALPNKTLVIYNADFDTQFFDIELLSLTSNIVCAMKLYAKAIGDWNDYYNDYRWHKLTEAARHTKHEWQGKAHSALSDCYACLHVYKWTVNELERQRIENEKKRQKRLKADARRKAKKKAELAKIPQTNRLNQKERSAAYFLKEFADALINGETIEFNTTDLSKLQSIGVNIHLVRHTKVNKLKRGKERPYYQVITNAPSWMRGKKSKHYLPFQIKEWKP